MDIAHYKTEMPKEICPERYIELYDIHRRYVGHEDELVDNRNTWFIALNSFLFTSMALSFRGFSDVFYSASSVLVFLFVFLLSLIGFALSLSSFFSVAAAYDSALEIKANWRTCYTNRYFKQMLASGVVLPAIVGGGPPMHMDSKYAKSNRRRIRLRGAASAKYLITAVGICWVFMAGFSFFGYVDQCRFAAHQVTQLDEPDPELGFVNAICFGGAM